MSALCPLSPKIFQETTPKAKSFFLALTGFFFRLFNFCLFPVFFPVSFSSGLLVLSKFKPFIVTSLYRPPGTPVSYFNDMEDLLASLNSDNKEAIIMGIQTVISWIHQTTTPKI